MPSVLRHWAKAHLPYAVRHGLRAAPVRLREFLAMRRLRCWARNRVVRPTLLRAIDLLSRPLIQPRENDPFHQNFLIFLEAANRFRDFRVLEVGARGSDLRPHFPGCRSYTGFDIHPGPGVHVTGDAHRLTDYFPDERFDVVFSISVFEHLAMPWKAALEMSKVLKVGGLLFVATHPTWPPHELPWDFWRFSAGGLRALLNRRLGFDVVCCDEGVPGMIVSLSPDANTRPLHTQPARLAVSAVARKVAEPDPALRWDIDITEFLQSTYPLRNREREE